jgi:hypothetical protein
MIKAFLLIEIDKDIRSLIQIQQLFSYQGMNRVELGNQRCILRYGLIFVSFA